MNYKRKMDEMIKEYSEKFMEIGRVQAKMDIGNIVDFYPKDEIISKIKEYINESSNN